MYRHRYPHRHSLRQTLRRLFRVQTKISTESAARELDQSLLALAKLTPEEIYKKYQSRRPPSGNGINTRCEAQASSHWRFSPRLRQGEITAISRRAPELGFCVIFENFQITFNGRDTLIHLRRYF